MDEGIRKLALIILSLDWRAEVEGEHKKMQMCRCTHCINRVAEQLTGPIAAARAEGRAAGYAEAKEQAAKACAARHDINRDKLKAWAQGGNDRMETVCDARMNEDDALLTIINSLAPADKEKP